MQTFKHLPDLLIQNCLKQPHAPALFSRNSNGLYHSVSYQQFYDEAFTLALGLKSFGIKQGDRIGLLSNNRPEWAYCDFAVQFLGAIDISIYPTLSAQEIGYILNDSESTAIFVETQEHFNAVRKVLVDCSHLKTIITFFEEDTTPFHGVEIVSLDHVMRIGKGHSDASRQALEQDIDRLDRQMTASIVYTSGTTGHPKGVMLTHENFLANVEGILAVTPVSKQDVVLSFLPLSHVFERTVGYYTLLAVGGKIYYAQNINTVSDDMRDAKPTVLVSVPRLYEKIQTRILDGLSGIKKWLFYWALWRGKAYKQKLAEKKDIPLLDRLSFKCADILVFRKIKARTGGRLRFFVSGGAPLSKDIGEFFNSLDLTIIEGYGQTETSPVIACNRVDGYKFGTVGKALPNVEVKQAEDGELLVRGPSIMKGYYNMPDATAEIIDSEGWLHTGDIIKQDSEGFISIVDRKKELIVLSNGKKVPPQMIESKLVSSPFILQAMVVGENRNFLTALIVPDLARYTRAKQHEVKVTDSDKILTDSQLHAFYMSVVSKKLEDLANYEKVKKICILAKELTPEAGELTPTLKFKRHVICSAFHDEIEQLYSDSHDH